MPGSTGSLTTPFQLNLNLRLDLTAGEVAKVSADLNITTAVSSLHISTLSTCPGAGAPGRALPRLPAPDPAARGRGQRGAEVMPL